MYHLFVFFVALAFTTWFDILDGILSIRFQPADLLSSFDLRLSV